MKTPALLLLGTFVLLSGTAWPLTSDLTVRQLNHRAFTSAQGAPGNVFALAQTSDGTLWVGGGTGLARFDGIRFVPYPDPAEAPLPHFSVTSLIASPDGGLWIGFGSGSVSFLKSNRVVSYGPRDGAPEDVVYQFSWDRDGSLWAATLNGLSRFKDNRWQRVVAEPSLNMLLGVLVDRADTLWVATASGLYSRAAGESRFTEVDERDFDYATSGVVLALARDGAVWAATPHEVLRVDRSGGRAHVVTVRGLSGGGPQLLDSQGNLWGASPKPDVLARVPSGQLTLKGQPELTVSPETFSRTDGYSGGRVQAVLEDREGNIWIGTSLGVEQFSYSNVRRETPSCDLGAIAAGDGGTLWTACASGVPVPGEALMQTRDGAVVSRKVTPPVSVAYRDRDGTLWFGGEDSLSHLEQGRVVTVPLPVHLRGRFVQALVRDAKGGMWVSVYDRDIARFADGLWSTQGNLAGLPRESALSAAADEAGVLWFGYADRVARVQGDRVQLFSTEGAVGAALSILAQGGQVWAGGELGLARFDGRRFVPVHNATTTPFKEISGIVRARNGDLWLNGMNGIARIPRREVERVMRDPTHRVACELFNHLDGVPGPALLYGSRPTALEGTDGRIWFLMSGGVVSIDATRPVRNTLVPPVTIWSLSSGSARYPARDADLSLPMGTTNVRIEYSAGSLTVPERVNFRYRLEGSDSDWQDAGTRREAVYTNLSPGHYTFRVTASNNDGVWNLSGASMRFTIVPAFYQTTWFHLLCALAAILVFAILYRARVRQVASQVRGRLEARLAERERIARDLHDTLLQGVQGLIWRFQAAADRIPQGEPARQLLEQSLDRAEKLLGESRDKVKDLRPMVRDAPDLAQALTSEGAELAQAHATAFRVSEQGARRNLHPIAREETLLIGREALGNAFRHSGAATVEVEVTYRDTALHIRIRDDGQGIATDVLDAGGRPGHFGLAGMRERAQKLGAHLQIWTKPGAGTEVDMRVPAEVAYRRSDRTAGKSRSWLAIFRST